MDNHEVATKIRSVIGVFEKVTIESTVNNVNHMSAGLMYLSKLAEHLENAEKDDANHESD